MDGLMFDTEFAYSVVQEKMCSKRGVVFSLEMKNKLMGKRANEVMDLLREFWLGSETVEELLVEQDGDLVRLYNLEVQKLYGLDQLLESLGNAGVRKCIGTSSRRFLVDVLLNRFDLQSEFEFVISGDDVKRGKPDPEIYNKCVRSLGLDASECLVLEDSRNGILSGKSAGCHAVAIPYTYTNNEDFSPADLVVTSLADNRLTKLALNDEG